MSGLHSAFETLKDKLFQSFIRAHVFDVEAAARQFEINEQPSFLKDSFYDTTEENEDILVLDKIPEPPPLVGVEIREKVRTFGDDKPVVNYMWINAAKVDPCSNDPMCAIELQYIERAVQNANMYPEADFKIWLDKKLIDDPTHFWVGSYIYDMAENSNIEICDLQDIADYAEDSLFDAANGKTGRSGEGNVYARADYARILVLDHCMRTMPERSRMIYSDMDCPDLRLYEAAGMIDKYGVAINDMNGKLVSHGYIGLNAKNENISEKFQTLKTTARSAAHGSELGFESFDKFLKDLGMPHREWRDRIGLRHVLPPCHEKIDPNPELEKLGIN